MIKEYNPTSAGIRARKTLVKFSTTNSPLKRLVKPLLGNTGRANGTITSRGKMQGAKRHYRVIDFKRDKFNIVATVTTIEHDPNRGQKYAASPCPSFSPHSSSRSFIGIGESPRGLRKRHLRSAFSL